MPVVSAEAVHERSISLGEIGVAVRLPGAVGGVLSTVIVVSMVVVPFVLLADRV
jgi:hypothetical protein